MTIAERLSIEDVALIKSTAERLQASVEAVIVGKPDVVRLALVALLCEGHILLEDVPGLGKTTLAKSIARSLGCTFKRIQFTPDLLPSDITGTYILDMRTNSFNLREGPIFAHVVLGDEINRAPAKTQSALLEAMQEQQVTIEGETRALPAPFLVLATQNPIEHEGTYPLPEAQVDRFLIKLIMGYPSEADEKRMLATYNRPVAEPATVVSTDDLVRMQKLAERVHVEEDLFDYVLGLTHFTRKHRRVYLGVSPRAALNLLHASKARALLKGRDFVLPDDVKHLCGSVLSHRILMTPEAELEGAHAAAVVDEAVAAVPYRRRR